MTKSDREELTRVAKLQAKVARAAVAQREAELLAGVEEQLAAKYKFDHNLWAEITKSAEQAIEEADQQIARICRANGIPEDFRPSIHLGWYDRGENASRARREELRRVAKARIAASGLAAKTAIEAQEAKVLVALITDGLETDEARAFLKSIPTPEQLMPPVALGELEVAEDDA